MNFIDAHVHVWTNDFARYPLAPGQNPLDMDVPCYGPDTILGEARPHGVNRIVLIQMTYYGFDNSYMTDTIAAQPAVFRGVAVVDHTAAGVATEIRRLKRLGVRGFRIYGLTGNLDRWLDHPGFDAMFRCAGEEGMAVCPLIAPEALPALAKMSERFPDTTVVVDHFARIGFGGTIHDHHITMLCALARLKAFSVKVSAFYGLGAGKPPYDDMIPLIRRVYESFGPRRMMWASDCPYQTHHGSYGDSVALVRDRLDFLSAQDKDWVLRRTAQRIFFDDQPAPTRR